MKKCAQKKNRLTEVWAAVWCQEEAGCKLSSAYGQEKRTAFKEKNQDPD